MYTYINLKGVIYIHRQCKDSFTHTSIDVCEVQKNPQDVYKMNLNFKCFKTGSFAPSLRAQQP